MVARTAHRYIPVDAAGAQRKGIRHIGSIASLLRPVLPHNCARGSTTRSSRQPLAPDQLRTPSVQKRPLFFDSKKLHLTARLIQIFYVYYKTNKILLKYH